MKYFNWITVLLVLLKLIGILTWSWFIVLLPSIIYFGITFISLIIVLILISIFGEAFKDELKDKFK